MARTSKVMTEAYCVELKRVVDIYTAREEYFSQPEPRNRYSFLCSDEECRKRFKPKVTGVNYNNETYKRLPHFRENENYGHSPDCYWVDIADAIKEAKKIKKGYRENCLNIEHNFSNLEPSQVYDKYVFETEMTESEQPTTVDGQFIREIQNKPNRVHEYAKYLLRTPKSTSVLERIVACYTLMSTEEKKKAKLMVGGHQFDSYYRAFKPNKWLEKFYTYPHIYYGVAFVEKDLKGYSIKYRDSIEKYETRNSSVVAGCYLPNSEIDKYTYRNYLYKILDITTSSKNKKCTFYIICNEHFIYTKGSNYRRSSLLNTEKSSLVEMFPESLRDIVIIPV